MPVVSLVTQIVIDENDPGFKNPTKPIGIFYSEEEAKELEAKHGFVMKEDAGRGYRRVVASPLPKEIVEIDAVKKLIGSSIVITCGGGSVPVVKKADGELEGIAAIIDKDFAAELLAEELGVDLFVILTEVEFVAENFTKENHRDLKRLTYAEAEKLMNEGHFWPGSMLPKVQAAMKFVKANPTKKAMISSLSNGKDAILGKTGTEIVWE